MPVAAIVAVAAIAVLLSQATGSFALAAGFCATLCAIVLLVAIAVRNAPPGPPAGPLVDWTLVRDAAGDSTSAFAVIDASGRLACTNRLYDDWFGARDPEAVVADFAKLAAVARRDGRARSERQSVGNRIVTVEVAPVGSGDGCLACRFLSDEGTGPVAGIVEVLNGDWGDRLATGGVMAALIGPEGRIRAANRALVARATGRADAPMTGRELAPLLSSDRNGTVRFGAEGPGGSPLRVFQLPLDPAAEDGERIIALVDDDTPRGEGADVPLQTLVGMLPVGLALADRDGRFLYLNQAFIRAAGLPPAAAPVYPGDLVIREDKAAVADAVRRFASGQAVSGDIAVRLCERPEEPVALTIAGARGLGEAAVLLSLKDNTEESRLKRQVAQATKMQAVGQLAGGVAHDFNNILTAIIGHCDLMLMRHTPGDSDYDDIQQVRINSNRAAGLTRQLLAFSRQQTLRPQVLQLPDIVSEVSNLLKRLLGETVQLVINHGRGLGAVRADPGQLEQVIVNLGVNARDAMPEGGTLTLRTYAVSATDVRRLNSDILPISDYTAMSLTDTGNGIAPDILSKIFEPFFTTKEVGKGTGLGLSTVYGIVKQSGGFIFADSTLGEGTSFVIYLPVHREEEVKPPEPARAAETPTELWGSGTILLVEDEDMVRAVAERALVRHGYTVLTASQGEEALAILGNGETIDLLVSDVVMPTMDGPTLVRAAREQFPDLPILFMSGYAEEQLRRSIDLDRIAFLPKPFSVKQLAEAVKLALDPK